MYVWKVQLLLERFQTIGSLYYCIKCLFSLNGVHWLFKIELHRTELCETDTLFQIHVFIIRLSKID